MPAKSLQELVDFARSHSPFYAQAYRDVPRTISHLTELPLIDQGAFWAANTWPDNRLLTGPLTDAGVYKTGGTTGVPKFSPGRAPSTPTRSPRSARAWSGPD